MTDSCGKSPDISSLAASSLKDLGLFVSKSLITLNGGAVVVMLTFVGHATKNTQFKIHPIMIKTSMLLFVVGLALALSLGIFSFARNYLTAMQKGNIDRTYGVMFSYFGLAFSSLLCFVVGALVVALSI